MSDTYYHTLPLTRAMLDEFVYAASDRREHMMDKWWSNHRVRQNLFDQGTAINVRELLDWLTKPRAPDAMYFYRTSIYLDWLDQSGAVAIRVRFTDSWTTAAEAFVDGMFIDMRDNDASYSRLNRDRLAFVIDRVKRINHSVSEPVSDEEVAQ